MKVSVVVPVRNEEDSIRELLDSLFAQTRPPDEIVITDGGSTDATPQIIEEYIRKGAPVRLIRAGAALPGRGRNLGAAQASHEWIAFTDAGIRLEKTWLEALVAKAESDERIDVVYGSWEPVTDTFFKQCAAIAYVPPPTSHDGTITRPRFIASTLLRREAWRAVNGFPEELRSAEDLLFMDRVENAGYRFVFEPCAQVHWDLRPTLWATFKRFVVYSRNNIRAGLFRQWQAAVFRYYGVIAILLALALIFKPSLVWLAIGAWLFLLVARAAVSIGRNRSCYPASLVQNLARGAMIMSLLAVLDAAAIIGSIQWLLLDCFRWSRKTPVEAGNGA
ncbi:MAG TPA: glycosyltransferase [Pyrinomonadaceae bacterium]|nr:glycosyltransferase [Pyrinomonadaceae bacterium]